MRSRRRRLGGFEPLEPRNLLAGMPYGATPVDTAEYMLGDVYVTVVFMESSTQTSPTNNNSETWNSASIAATKQKVQQGLQWWEDALAAITTRHELDFQLDFTYADSPVVSTFEPITRPSTDVQFWVYDFLNVVGFNRMGNFHDDIRAFNHAQREAHGTDWAFTIFVVHDENDADHQFAPGGFARAFAFAGGEFLVSPSSRPASTFAHETGHQFWGLDEYRPDGDVSRFRGYYNTQNVNAWNNPASGFVQQPSIMTNGTLLDAAFASYTSARSTLEMIGWKDSDQDGVFDVLDVPLTLTGSGDYDPASGRYRFVGASTVQTLPNRNPSGSGNDITLNEVSRAQFRVDGGNWETAAVYGTAKATLDLDFAVPATANEVEIRTIDDVSGVTSNVFRGVLHEPAGVVLPGINGVVWEDLDRDGVIDANEEGLGGVTVRLLDSLQQPLTLQQTVEPDSHPAGTRLNNISPMVTLSATGSGVSDNTVAARNAAQASTGNSVFAGFSSSCAGFCTEWTTTTRQLRLDFADPVSVVQLDAIGASLPGRGRLELYNANNQLLSRYTTGALASGEVETMRIERPVADIKYAIARGHADTMIRFDNLRFGPLASAVTDSNGAYSIPYLGEGAFTVHVVASAGQSVTSPAAGTQAVMLTPGEGQGRINFGLAVLPGRWQNSRDRFDVNGDGAVSPLDALVIINDLNRSGARALGESDVTPPYVDVNGDSQVSPLDVLQVVNQLNRSLGGGEAESSEPLSWSMASALSASAEGEAWHATTAGEGGEMAVMPGYGPLLANRGTGGPSSSAGGTLDIGRPWVPSPPASAAMRLPALAFEFPGGRATSVPRPPCPSAVSQPEREFVLSDGFPRLLAAGIGTKKSGERIVPLAGQEFKSSLDSLAADFTRE